MNNKFGCVDSDLQETTRRTQSQSQRNKTKTNHQVENDKTGWVGQSRERGGCISKLIQEIIQGLSDRPAEVQCNKPWTDRHGSSYAVAGRVIDVGGHSAQETGLFQCLSKSMFMWFYHTPIQGHRESSFAGVNGLNMPTKGVGSRDYPYFTNLPKNAGLRFADRCFFWGSVTPQPPSRRPCTHSASLVNLYSYGFGALFIPRELELPAVQKIYDNSKNSQIGSEVFCNSLENHKPFSPILWPGENMRFWIKNL